MKCNTDINRVKVSYGVVSCDIQNEQKATERALRRAERLGKGNIYKSGDRLPEVQDRSFHAEYYRDGKGKLRSERLVETTCKLSTLQLLQEAGADVSSVQTVRYIKAKSVKETAKVFEPFKALPVGKDKPACAKGARSGGTQDRFDPDLQAIHHGVARISLPEVKESVLKGRAVSERKMALQFEQYRLHKLIGWLPSAKEDKAVVKKMIQMKVDGEVRNWKDFFMMENPYTHKHYRSVWDKWCLYVS